VAAVPTRGWNAAASFTTMIYQSKPKPASRIAWVSRTKGGPAVNIHAKAATSTPTMSSEEWQARVDLAAVYRLVAQHGWDDVIYNHCSMRVPGEDRKFLMKRH
jgi:hypothetical protein